MSRNPDHPDDSTLRFDDAEALDALVDAAFDLNQIDHQHVDSGCKLLNLFSLLDLDVNEGTGSGHSGRSDRLLVDVTMARILRQRDRDVAAKIPAGPAQTGLSEADARSIDALVAAGWDDRASVSEDPERHSAAAGLLALLNCGLSSSTLAEERESLIGTTLGRIQSSIDRNARRLRISGGHDQLTAGRSRFSLSDLGALAAILLLGTVVLWPVLVGMRESSRQEACASGLQKAAFGFDLFANDHDGKLPRRTRPDASSPWWNVGDSRHSHSSNLYLLISEGYASHANLACPGNEHAPTEATDPHARDWASHDAVSYSYQVFGPKAPRWEQPLRMVVLVDKSPVVARARRGEGFDPLAPSRLHNATGQNVLFSDGSVEFLVRPVLENGDLIWLPRSAEQTHDARLRGVETADDQSDAFVGP